MRKTRPILFDVPSVQAIFRGQKTQTRRLVIPKYPLSYLGPSGSTADPSEWGYFFDGPDHHGYMVLGRGHDERHDHGRISIPCPHGDVGDRWWVKESFTHITGNGFSIHYRADGEPVGADGEILPTRPGCPRWLSSVRMPRKWSRIELKVVQVHVQRLQDIREEEVRAEGFAAVADFKCHWDAMHHKRAPWGLNPWVWAIEFAILSTERKTRV